MIKKANNKAFTLIELLIVIAIIGLLAALALPAITGALARAQLTGIVSNARQIHVAAQQQALDVLTGSSTVGWPGDSGNSPATASAKAFLGTLKDNGYLKEAEVIKLVSGPGFPAAASWTALANTNIQFRIGNVTSGEAGTVMWLWTKNFEPNSDNPLTATALKATVGPGKAGFVIFRKGGDGQSFQEKTLDLAAAVKEQTMGSMPASTTKVLTDS